MRHARLIERYRRYVFEIGQQLLKLLIAKMTFSFWSFTSASRY